MRWLLLLLTAVLAAGEVQPTVHITSERPWYRPGETVCLRVLLLEAVTRAPLATRLPVTLRSRDGRGTVVWAGVAAAEDGVASAGWTAPETGGAYLLEAEAGRIEAEPRRILVATSGEGIGSAVAASLEFDRRGYAPGDTAGIALVLRDREGRPVAGAPATLRVALPDGSAREERVVSGADGRATIAVPLPATLERTDATVTARLADGSIASRAIPLASASLELRADVEGGALVAGRLATVFVQARSRDGQPVDARGEVRDGAGAVVAAFTVQHEGRARCAFVPVAGAAYRLVCLAPVPQEVALPAVLPTGAVLQGEAIQAAGEPLRLRLLAPPGSHRLTVLRRGVAVASASAVDGEAIALAVPGAGVVDVVVAREDGTTVAQRTIFRRPAPRLALELAAPPTAEAGEQVAVALRLRGIGGDAVPGLVSLAAVEAGDEDLLEARERPPRLPAIAWLDGEVEELADADAYLGADAASAERLALLLGVQGWRRGVAGERLQRLRRGPTPILPAMLAPALDAKGPALGLLDLLGVQDMEMGGQGAFMAIGAGGGGAGMFGSRTGGGRRRALGRHGGSRASESAVDACLRFLKRAQGMDGGWSAADWPRSGRFEAAPDGVGTWIGDSADRCTTALALLPFLGAGYDHRTPNKYKPVVAIGLAWLRAHLAADGSFDADPVVQAAGVIALAEAYAMTSDPELRQPAQLALARLGAMQHAGGGWAASGDARDARADAQATAWATMAYKSAYAGGLSVGDTLERVKAWLGRAYGAANPPDRPTGAFPGVFDAATGTAHAPERTAAGAMMAVFLGHRAGDALLEGLAGRLAVQAPLTPPYDPQTLYWGTLGMFQVGGERWRVWNSIVRDRLVGEQRREGATDGSWDPLVLGDSGARWGRVLASVHACLTLEVYYRYAQVQQTRQAATAFVGHVALRRLAAVGDPDAPQPPGTLAWWAAEPVDAQGRVELRLPATGRARRLTLRADALDAGGGFAVAETTLTVGGPPTIDVRLPARLVLGDRWEAPLVGAKVAGVEAREGVTAHLADGHLALGAASLGLAEVQVRADGTRRVARIAVQPPGVPWRAGGVGGGGAAIPLPALLDRREPVRGVVLIERDIESRLAAIHSEFLRQPNGCFEQTSATSYPLALSCLRRRQAHLGDDAEALGFLAGAAKRLQGFASPGGGYSMFGRSAGDPVLTAFGLRQLRLLATLVPVDVAQLAAQRAWLLAQRDRDGRFRPGAATSDARLAQVQISADLGSDCPPEDRQRAYADAVALGGGYALALAARLAGECGDTATANGLAARIVRGPEGEVAQPGPSPWRPQATVEATALVLALDLQAGRPVDRGLAWLAACCRGAAWGVTQENVHGIAALIAAERLLPQPEACTIVVEQGGRELGRLAVAVATPGRQILAFTADPAGGQVRIAVQGRANWRWELSGSQVRPADGVGSPLALTTSLPERLAAGQPCELLAVATSRTAVYAPLLRLGLPAGLEPRPEALDRLVRAGRIAHWEQVEGELRIYGEGLAAGGRWEVPIACVAVAAGSFRGRPSCVLPYYQPELAVWRDGLEAAIAR